MKRRLSSALLAVAAFAAGLAVVFALATPAASGSADTDADNSQTLNGRYVWTNGGDRGDLKAVFTPSGEGTWDVEFYFRFRDRPHNYSGSARGALGEGELSGTVQNERRNRTFTFEGRFEDGTFRGDHFEGRQKTGTLTLK